MKKQIISAGAIMLELNFSQVMEIIGWKL